jgi:dolichol-phosphate mannosyltransferase
LPPAQALGPEISVVVPLYNESENVAPLVQQVLAALKQERRTIELVLVDDASTDDTWGQVAAARRADARVRGIRHSRNSGQSAALWTGFRGTNAPLIATLDGDLQNDPAEFPRMLAELERYDLICGMRVARQDNFLRRVSSGVARWARGRVVGAEFKDVGCGLRVFRRSVLDGLFAFNGFHRFMPILVHATGGRVCEIPVSHRPRVAGVSKYGVWNRLGRGIFDLFAIAWFQKRRIGIIPTTEIPAKPGGTSEG